MPKIKLTFKNNSVSGRDYRAKGVHIEIPGLSTVSANVVAEAAEKIVADIRRTSPAIQVTVHDSVAEPESLDTEEGAECDQPEGPVNVAPAPAPANRKAGGRKKRPKRKPPKAQKPTATLESVVEQSDASEVTVQEVIEE